MSEKAVAEREISLAERESALKYLLVEVSVDAPESERASSKSRSPEKSKLPFLKFFTLLLI